MGTRTSHPHGTFSWVDLATTDIADAKRFYGELFGWEAEDMPAGEGMTYTMFRLDGAEVAAGSESGQQQGPPHWNSYITVDDVDALAPRVTELGGTLHAGPFDVLEAGRMAVVQDPSGAFVCLWEARREIGARRVNDPGCLTWNDLSTRDPEAAGAFYAELLGWELMVVDPRYTVVRVGGRSNGGIRPLGEEMEPEVPPFWLPYFTVESADGAVTRAQELGGGVLAPAMDLPNGRIAVLRDPQGAAFAVFEGEIDD